MEAERFDRLVGAVSTMVSRRRGVAALLAGLLAAALPALDLDAKRRHPTHDQGKSGGHKHSQTSDRSRHVAPSPGDGRLTGQIANGTSVTQGKYPFAVSIRASRSDGSGSLCTGSLISPSHVLTAAHCTVDSRAGAFFPLSAFTVVVGQVNRLDTTCADCRKRVTAVAVDPSWAPNQFVVPHDIAVLKLDTPVSTSIGQPITFLASGDGSREAVGQAAIAAGWGGPSNSASNRPKIVAAAFVDNCWLTMARTRAVR